MENTGDTNDTNDTNDLRTIRIQNRQKRIEERNRRIARRNESFNNRTENQTIDLNLDNPTKRQMTKIRSIYRMMEMVKILCDSGMFNEAHKERELAELDDKAIENIKDETYAAKLMSFLRKNPPEKILQETNAVINFKSKYDSLNASKMEINMANANIMRFNEMIETQYKAIESSEQKQDKILEELVEESKVVEEYLKKHNVEIKIPDINENIIKQTITHLLGIGN